MKIFIRAVLERIGLFFLKLAKSEVRVYPVHMLLYEPEIRQLCEEESKLMLSANDVLGSHYFRARRIMTKMKIKHPALDVRDLWKAVDMIFDYEELK